jgi:hypothetical protein
MCQLLPAAQAPVHQTTEAMLPSESNISLYCSELHAMFYDSDTPSTTLTRDAEAWIVFVALVTMPGRPARACIARWTMRRTDIFYSGCGAPWTPINTVAAGLLLLR